MKRVLTRRFRFRTATPVVSIKKQGRVILNRPAASFFEDAGYTKVVLYWDDETHLLSIQGTKSHLEEHEVYFGGQKAIPAAFSAKTALQTIGYNFSENRTFTGKFNPEDASIEITIPDDFLLSPETPVPQRDRVAAERRV